MAEPSGQSRIDAAALAELLRLADLFDPGLSSAVVQLAGCFPAETGRNLFVEYELGEEVTPSGFGVGFPWGFYDHCIATDHGFVQSPAGRAVAEAMKADPFASDPAAPLGLLGDDDPDWIEYDIALGRIDATPFVFFRPPSRLSRIATPEQAGSLCDLLDGAAMGGQFAALLDLLVGLGPVGMYRIGRARQRGDRWWRAIASNLQYDQVVAALRSQGGIDFEEPLELAMGLYAGRADTPGSRFALSIDVQDGCITAIDVECPYLYRIGDPSMASAAFSSLLDRWRRRGMLSEPTAGWLASQCCRDIVAAGSHAAMRVRVHHLKFRLFGSPHLRTKAYLHLETTADEAGTSP